MHNALCYEKLSGSRVRCNTCQWCCIINLDAWRVDVKGFSDFFYRELAKITHWRQILEVTKRANAKWDMHVEVVTNIVPTMNDGDWQLEDITSWIRDEMCELTPWHVTRFYPHHYMNHLPPPHYLLLKMPVRLGKKLVLSLSMLKMLPGIKVRIQCAIPVVGL
jgi:pyruvate formate lyase activating enzyme